MTISKIYLTFILSIIGYALQAQESSDDDLDLIKITLTDYIEGSTNGQPQRLSGAFHEDLNLYYVRDGKLKTWSGKAYIEDTKEGEPTGEIGKIISIDFENDIAIAKVQVSDKESPSTYVDYFMLVKLEDGWKIVHKMFTKRVK